MFVYLQCVYRDNMARFGDVLMVWCAVLSSYCLMNVLTGAEEPGM